MSNRSFCLRLVGYLKKDIPSLFPSLNIQKYLIIKSYWYKTIQHNINYSINQHTIQKEKGNLSTNM